MEKERRIQLGLPDLEVLRAQMIYDQVLKDMKRYAESQAGDVEKIERLGYYGLSGKPEYGE